MTYLLILETILMLLLVFYTRLLKRTIQTKNIDIAFLKRRLEESEGKR